MKAIARLSPLFGAPAHAGCATSRSTAPLPAGINGSGVRDGLFYFE